VPITGHASDAVTLDASDLGGADTQKVNAQGTRAAYAAVLPDGRYELYSVGVHGSASGRFRLNPPLPNGAIGVFPTEDGFTFTADGHSAVFIADAETAQKLELWAATDLWMSSQLPIVKK
jgi:hypothetical protein